MVVMMDSNDDHGPATAELLLGVFSWQQVYEVLHSKPTKDQKASPQCKFKTKTMAIRSKARVSDLLEVLLSQRWMSPEVGGTCSQINQVQEDLESPPGRFPC